MTAYLDIDALCWEMKSLKENNRLTFSQIRKQILENVKDIINENKQEVITKTKR